MKHNDLYVYILYWKAYRRLIDVFINRDAAEKSRRDMLRQLGQHTQLEIERHRVRKKAFPSTNHYRKE